MKKNLNQWKDKKLEEINKPVIECYGSEGDLKIDLEAIQKTQTKAILDMENLGEWARATRTTSTPNSISEMEERISSVGDTAEEIDLSVKRNVKS